MAPEPSTELLSTTNTSVSTPSGRCFCMSANVPRESSTGKTQRLSPCLARTFKVRALYMLMAGPVTKACFPDNKLTVNSDAGDEITGFIDPETLAFTTGIWINGQQQSGGSFTGGGCRLN